MGKSGLDGKAIIAGLSTPDRARFCDWSMMVLTAGATASCTGGASVVVSTADACKTGQPPAAATVADGEGCFESAKLNLCNVLSEARCTPFADASFVVEVHAPPDNGY